MLPRYPWILFDADDTLFDFGYAEGQALRETFEGLGMAFDAAWLPVYQRVNAAAWRALETGAVNPTQLRVLRFERLAEELGLPIDASSFSAAYLRRLAMQTKLIDGALAVVWMLQPRHRLAIITNGLADVQRPRLARSALRHAFEHIVISEEVGVAKPDPAFFEIALGRLGGPSRADVLVVGDSLASDIAGGTAAGLDTCWFNPGGRERGAGPGPRYEIRRLDELPAIAEGLSSAGRPLPPQG
jgi:2-haloacid dehalogenase